MTEDVHYLPCGVFHSWDHEFLDLRLEIEANHQFSLKVSKWDAENCVHTDTQLHIGTWSISDLILSLVCPQFSLQYEITTHSLQIANSPEFFIPALDPIGDHSVLGVPSASFAFFGRNNKPDLKF